MNLKKIYLLLITLVFGLTVFSQYTLTIDIKNKTDDGKYLCSGYIKNSASQVQYYSFIVPAGVGSSGSYTFSLTTTDWKLHYLRIAHDSGNTPIANLYYGANLYTYDFVFRPSSGDNVVKNVGYGGVGNKHYGYDINPQ